MANRNQTPDEESGVNPPWLALVLLSMFSPGKHKEHLIGDVIEEFEDRAAICQSDASKWLWQQTLKTSGHFIGEYLLSDSFLRTVLSVSSLMLVVCAIVFISWLSSATHIEPDVWAETLQGKVHALFLEDSVFGTGVQALIEQFDVGMFVHPQSVLWAAVCFGFLFIADKSITFSARQIAFLGSILMFLPYLCGVLYIRLLAPQPDKIGPVIAFMVIPFIYMAIPLAIWAIKRSRKPPH